MNIFIKLCDTELLYQYKIWNSGPIIRTKISLKSYILQTQQRFCYSLYCILMRNSLFWWRSQNLCNRLYYCLWVCQFPNSQTSSSPSWTDWEFLDYTKIMLLSINMPQVSLLQYVWIQKPFHWKSVFPMCK